MRKCLIIAGVALLTGIALLVTLQFVGSSGIARPEGPGAVYKGRTVEDWVSRVWAASTSMNPEILTVAEIGEPAVPYLVQRLQEPAAIRRSRLYRKIWEALPAAARRRLAPPAPDQATQEQLIASAAFTLGRIGSASGPAVEALGQIAVNERFRSSTRLFAVQALGQIGSAASNAVPEIVACLHDNRRRLAAVYDKPQHADAADRNLRTAAARALARIGVSTAAAAPLLDDLLQSTNAIARSTAAVALWRTSGATTHFDTVARLLRSDQSELQRSTIIILGAVGPPARPFLPLIRDAAHAMEELEPAAALAIQRIETDTSVRK